MHFAQWDHIYSSSLPYCPKEQVEWRRRSSQQRHSGLAASSASFTIGSYAHSAPWTALCLRLSNQRNCRILFVLHFFPFNFVALVCYFCFHQCWILYGRSAGRFGNARECKHLLRRRYDFFRRICHCTVCGMTKSENNINVKIRRLAQVVIPIRFTVI